jgi:hypothetical protein
MQAHLRAYFATRSAPGGLKVTLQDNSHPLTPAEGHARPEEQPQTPTSFLDAKPSPSRPSQKFCKNFFATAWSVLGAELDPDAAFLHG